jgi:hypothetical protein
MKNKDYFYRVNLNERGYFYADIHDENDNTIFEIKNNDDGYIDLITDGFMQNILDLEGLTEYLVGVGIINKGDMIYEKQ